MTKTELYDALDYVNSSRQKRMEMANLVRNEPKLLLPLIEIVMEADNPLSVKAAWVMEFTVKQDLSLIFPLLDKFTAGIGSLHLDSAVRPMAKICEYLILAYFSKKPNEVRKVLEEHHLEAIATACFDWLIGDYKVAAKAYSMTSLYLLGKKFKWIHPELRLVLERHYATSSAAYKARARHTLAKLNN